MHLSQASNCSFTFPECRKVWNSAGSSVQVDALGCHRRLPCNTLSFNCNQNSLHHVLDKDSFVHMYVRDEVMMLEDFSAAGPGRWSPNHSVMDGHFGSQTQIDIISQFLIDTEWFTNHLNYQKDHLGIDMMKYDIALLRVVCELGTKAKDLSGKNMLMT